jgi:predicted AAA+ superfamily ATPase
MELNQLARQDGSRYSRSRPFLQTMLQEKGKHFIGIAGPRGAGKTVLLKQVALARENSFYLSLDTFQDGDLFDLIKKLNRDLGFSLFLLDEIHFYKGYDEQLKKIYDFLDVRVIFTSSVSLSIFKSSYDLSRRVVIKKLFPFSFREYVYFRSGELLPVLTIRDIREKNGLLPYLRSEYLFDEYLKGGVLPFALEEPDPLVLLKNIVTKVISRDIPQIAGITLNETDLLEKALSFIGRSSVDGINYSSLSKNLGITKYKAAQYMDLLEKAFIIHQIFPMGTNVLKEPKVLMALPYRLLYMDRENCIGALREDFFAGIMRSADIPFHYLKNKRGAKMPDYLISGNHENLIIEIGGKGKGYSQFKGIKDVEKLVFSHYGGVKGLKRPLFTLGFLS